MKELMELGTVLMNYSINARTWDFLEIYVAYILFFTNP
jgi:hypothetical protein